MILGLCLVCGSWLSWQCRVAWLDVLAESHQSGSGRCSSSAVGWWGQAQRATRSQCWVWHTALPCSTPLSLMAHFLCISPFLHTSHPSWISCNNRHIVKFLIVYWDKHSSSDFLNWGDFLVKTVLIKLRSLIRLKMPLCEWQLDLLVKCQCPKTFNGLGSLTIVQTVPVQR